MYRDTLSALGKSFILPDHYLRHTELMHTEYNQIVDNLESAPLESDDEVEALLGELRIQTDDEFTESGGIDLEGIPRHQSPRRSSDMDTLVHDMPSSHERQSRRKSDRTRSVNNRPSALPRPILKTKGQSNPASNPTKSVNQKWYVLTTERCKLCATSDNECWVSASGKKGACLFCIKRKVKCQYSEKGWIDAPGLHLNSKSPIVPKHVTFVDGRSPGFMEMQSSTNLTTFGLITSGIKEVQQNSKDLKEAGLAYITSIHAYNQKVDEVQLLLDNIDDM